MSLTKYIGTYRVLADYDLDTKDFIRDENGKIPREFDDYYIPCKKGIQIRGACNGELIAFVWSKKLFNSIIRQANDKIKSFDELDEEGCFTFQEKDLPYFAKLLKAREDGARTDPFSKRNLPKKG